MKKAIKEYEKSCAKLIELFGEKHELDFDYWVADIVGQIAVFGDYFVDLSNIIIDLKRGNKDSFFEWYDLAIDKDKSINYNSFLMNFGL